MRLALADCVLVDASQGEFATVSREHFPDHHFALTSAVFPFINATVETAEGAGFVGIFPDILWMSRVCPVQLLPGGYTFKVGFATASFSAGTN